jgi:hypothetical protein
MKTHSLPHPGPLRSRLTRLLWATSVAACLAEPAAFAVNVSLEPVPTSVTLGQPLSLAVRISGLGHGVAPSLGAFDLSVDYDAARFHFDSLLLGDPVLGDLLGPVTGSTGAGTHDPLAARVNLYSVSLDLPSDLDAAQPDSFILGTLLFTATGVGSGMFGLADVILADADGADLPIDTLLAVSVAVRDSGTASVPDQGATTSGVGFLLGFTWLASRWARRV